MFPASKFQYAYFGSLCVVFFFFFSFLVCTYWVEILLSILEAILFVCLIEALTCRSTILQSFWDGFLGLNSTKQWDKVSCSRTQHCTPGEDRTRDLAIKESDALPTELLVLLSMVFEHFPWQKKR